MKLSVLVFFFLFSNFSLLAAEREFRINRNSITKNGFAIAWGVKNKKTDFEALDKKSPEEISNFIETSFLVNYVVDIETDKVLSEVKSDGTEFTISGMRYGNHFSLEISPFQVDGLDYEEEVLVLVENWKWSNTINSLFLINRKQGIEVKKTLKDNKFDRLLKNAIATKLKGTELDFFTNGATTLTNMEEVAIDKLGNAMELTLWSEFPKSDRPGLAVKAVVFVKYENDQFNVNVHSLETKLD